MKYAISTDNGNVSAHFGRCPSYTYINIEDGKVLDQKEEPNPGHTTGSIPVYLNEHNVNVIIAGGMGSRAVGLFQQFGIESVVGVSGSISDVVKQILADTLEGGGTLCSPQGGHGYGIPKTDGHGI